MVKFTGKNAKFMCERKPNYAKRIIYSPNYPDYYPPRKDCVWHFSTTPGHRIKLVFTVFEMEPHQVYELRQNFYYFFYFDGVVEYRNAHMIMLPFTMEIHRKVFHWVVFVVRKFLIQLLLHRMKCLWYSSRMSVFNVVVLLRPIRLVCT